MGGFASAQSMVARTQVILVGLMLCALVALSPQRAGASVLPTELVLAAWAKPGAHPLIGRIWIARDNRFVDGFALSRGVLTGTPIADVLEIKRAAYVLLGEVHDNGEHHKLRAGLIDDLTGRTAFGRMTHPGVVIEHIDDGDDARLARINRSIVEGTTSPDKLLEDLAWDKSGWPPAPLFRPLFEAIVEARLALRAGNVPRREIRDVVRGGPAAVAADRRERFGLDRLLPPALAATLDKEIEASHCGVLPASAIEGMSRAQRYRDGRMASAMIEADAAAGKTILLAGNGHVRTDRGVPWHIRAQRPQATVVAVMLVEVEAGKNDPLAYVPRDPDGRPAVDAVVFTPRTEREDPCEQMRAHMQKKG